MAKRSTGKTQARFSAPNLLDIVVMKITSLRRDDHTKKPIKAAAGVRVKLKKDLIIRIGLRKAARCPPFL